MRLNRFASLSRCSLAELRGMVSYSALKAVCAAGDDVVRQRKALKKLFGSFVKCDKNVVRTQVRVALMRMGTAGIAERENTPIERDVGFQQV